MTILVTGANGQLGNEMRIVSQGSEHRFVFTDVEELDITSLEAVRAMVGSVGADVVVNCAAYTNVDRAEEEPQLAERLNATAAGHLAEAMKEVGGLLVHVSTDYVFGGSQGNTPRTEEEAANPTGVYGLTKLRGEEAILRAGCRHVILRTAWLYSEYGKNFVKTMLALTATKPELKVVFDQVGTPTYALDLARAIMHIVEHPVEGTFHYSNEGVCSWYDFAKAIAQMAGHEACDVQPCHSSEFPSKVVRPSYSVLDKTKIKRTYGLRIPYWTESLRRCLDAMSGETHREPKDS